MQVKMVPREDVKPYPGNPRKNEDAIADVAASLSEFGWRQPIVVDKEMVIVAGHTRHAAAEQLGMDKVPVVIADDLSAEKIRAYRLADNKTGEKAEWDLGKLRLELVDLHEAGA